MFLKIAAGILITTIVTLAISKKSADISTLLTILVCCMAVITAINYIRPVIDFMERLVSIGDIEMDIFQILLKTAGIGIISHVVSLVCADAGNQTLGKTLQFVATAIILCLCIPLLDRVLILIETVLGKV